jgi:hypothetical protein
MRTYTATTVTVGSGRSIHWGDQDGTLCGAAHRNGRFTKPALVQTETATCKRCIRIMAAEVEQAHAAAIAEREIREGQAALAEADVKAEQVWISQDIAGENATVTSTSVTRLGVLVYYTITGGPRMGKRCGLPLADFLGWFKREAPEVARAHAEALNEDAQRRYDAERAEALAAPSVAFPGAVALDTWLTAGLVLVGPATDSLYVFESWDGGTAVLTHVDTGATEHVAQADIVNWRYLPGIELDEVCAVELRKGDVVRFHEGGKFRTVADVEHHKGTALYSFSVEGAVTQFVRQASALVRRLDLPRR